MVKCIFASCGCREETVWCARAPRKRAQKRNFRRRRERAVVVWTQVSWLFLPMRTLICAFSPFVSLFTWAILQLKGKEPQVERQWGRRRSDTSKPAPVNFARKIHHQSPVTMQPLLIAFLPEFPRTWLARMYPSTPTPLLHESIDPFFKTYFGRGFFFQP